MQISAEGTRLLLPILSQHTHTHTNNTVCLTCPDLETTAAALLQHKFRVPL